MKSGGWRRVIAYALQGAVAAVTLLVFLQAVLAGQFLSGNATALSLHEVNGTEILGPFLILQAVLAIVVWRPGRGPRWPILATVLVFVAVMLQIGYGFEGRLALHVPLGVAILLVEFAMLMASRGMAARMAR